MMSTRVPKAVENDLVEYERTIRWDHFQGASLEKLLDFFKEIVKDDELLLKATFHGSVTKDGIQFFLRYKAKATPDQIQAWADFQAFNDLKQKLVGQGYTGIL